MQMHLRSSVNTQEKTNFTLVKNTAAQWMWAAELQIEVAAFCVFTVSVSSFLRLLLTWLPSLSSSFSLALPPSHSLSLSSFVTNGDAGCLKFASSCFLRTSYILHGFHSPELGHCSFWHEAWCSHLLSPVPMATMRPVKLVATTPTTATEQWIFYLFYFIFFWWSEFWLIKQTNKNVHSKWCFSPTQHKLNAANVSVCLVLNFFFNTTEVYCIHLANKKIRSFSRYFSQSNPAPTSFLVFRANYFPCALCPLCTSCYFFKTRFSDKCLYTQIPMFREHRKWLHPKVDSGRKPVQHVYFNMGLRH